MTLAFHVDRAADEPSTHALVVGIDSYPWLRQAIPGLDSLSSCCNSALVFYGWLTQHFRNQRAPLGSVRLLLSPADQIRPGREMPRIDPATRENFFQELVAWAENLSRNRDSVGLFYFAGHGFGAGFDQRILAMSETGQTEFSPFQACVSFDNIYQGLAPNERRPDMARQQYFFLDCGSPTRSIPNFLERNASQLFAIPSFTMTDDREAVTFSAAAPEGLAWALPNGTTLFMNALISSFDGSGAQLPGPSERAPNSWVVTASSLASGLSFESQRLREEHHLDIQFPMSGVGFVNRGAVLHELAEPPKVVFRVLLDGHVEPDLAVVLKDPLTDHQFDFAIAGEGDQRRAELVAPAGIYQIEVRSGGEIVGKPMIMLAQPPLVRLKL